MSHVHNGTHSWLLEYISRCKSGEEIIGQELMMWLNILETYFDHPDIRVDFADAHKRIRFIETQCKHFEAPFAGKPFILLPFQKAFIESIYIFKIYDAEMQKWVKKHTDNLLVIGRKGGKTPFVGALNLAEFFCGPVGTKILCSGNDYEQASLMFDAMNNMREESPSLAKVTRKNLQGIYFGNPSNKKTKGKFSYQNKGSIRKISSRTGFKEGRNIRVGAVDEAHELKDNSSIMPIRQALSTQDDPLYFEISTEGFVDDGYLDQRTEEAKQVLRGELERPRWNIWLYTQDSEAEIWQDEKTWLKSNPGLGTIKKWSFLRGMVEEAKTNMATRAFVLAKDFNIKQNASTAWLQPEVIVNEETFDLADLAGSFAIGGVDLSKSGDLANAKAIIMRRGDNTKYITSQYFIPESKIEELPREDKDKFLEWIKAGLITISPGNENDFSLVTAWFVKLFKDYGIRTYKVGYDKWGAVYWKKEMEDLGFDCDRVDQNWGTMSEPMKMVEADLKSKLINYNNNPIDRWCLENTSLAINSQADIMPVKIKGKEDKKIDGAVTMIIGYRVYLDNRSEFLRLVEGR